MYSSKRGSRPGRAKPRDQGLRQQEISQLTAAGDVSAQNPRKKEIKIHRHSGRHVLCLSIEDLAVVYQEQPITGFSTVRPHAIFRSPGLHNVIDSEARRLELSGRVKSTAFPRAGPFVGGNAPKTR